MVSGEVPMSKSGRLLVCRAEALRPAVRHDKLRRHASLRSRTIPIEP